MQRYNLILRSVLIVLYLLPLLISFYVFKGISRVVLRGKQPFLSASANASNPRTCVSIFLHFLSLVKRLG